MVTCTNPRSSRLVFRWQARAAGSCRTPGELWGSHSPDARRGSRADVARSMRAPPRRRAHCAARTTRQGSYCEPVHLRRALSAARSRAAPGLDRSECRPNLALKRGAPGCNGDGIDRAEIAQEVVADRPPNWRGCGAVLYSEVISFRAIMEPEKTPHVRLEVVKVESAHMSFAIMDEK